MYCHSSESHKPVAFTVLNRYMIEYHGAEFSLFAAGALEQAVINNERIDTVIVGKRVN